MSEINMSNFDKFYKASKDELFVLCCELGLEEVSRVRDIVKDFWTGRDVDVLEDFFETYNKSNREFESAEYEKLSSLLSFLNKMCFYLSDSTTKTISIKSKTREQAIEFVDQWRHKQDLYRAMCMTYRDRADKLIEEASQLMEDSDEVGINTSSCFDCQNKLDELRREFIAREDEDYGMTWTAQHTIQYIIDAKEEIMDIALSSKKAKTPKVYSNKPIRSGIVNEAPKVQKKVFSKPKRN